MNRLFLVTVLSVISVASFAGGQTDGERSGKPAGAPS
jgi:hypothetical protein